MATYILTAILFLLAVLAMVAGVLITGRSLKGSCGGPSCTCARDGKDLLGCEVEESGRESTLPVHPGV
jgi:hypothetical protein